MHHEVLIEVLDYLKFFGKEQVKEALEIILVMILAIEYCYFSVFRNMMHRLTHVDKIVFVFVASKAILIFYARTEIKH